MEQRSPPGSLAFPLTWGPTPSAAAVVAALKTPLVALEALAAAVLGALMLQELLARVVWAVVAVVAVAPLLPPEMAAPAEPAAWRFNMPTTAMWQPET
jgi:hypothetical protein